MFRGAVVADSCSRSELSRPVMSSPATWSRILLEKLMLANLVNDFLDLHCLVHESLSLDFTESHMNRAQIHIIEGDVSVCPL